VCVCACIYLLGIIKLLLLHIAPLLRLIVRGIPVRVCVRVCVCVCVCAHVCVCVGFSVPVCVHVYMLARVRVSVFFL
jgi:hypothetical protein